MEQSSDSSTRLQQTDVSLSVKTQENKISKAIQTNKGEENFEDIAIYECNHANEILETQPMITYNEVDIGSINNKELFISNYNKFIGKFLSGELKQKKFVNGFIREKEMNKDMSSLEEIKRTMLEYQKYYNSQLSKLQFIKKKKEKTDNIAQREIIRKENEDIEDKIAKKEQFYKETVQSLLKELKRETHDNINLDLVKEANEFFNTNINSNEEESNFSKEALNRSTTTTSIKRSKVKSNKALIDKQKIDDNTENSLLNELESFKKEEKLYKFEIPSKYIMSQFVKCKKEKKIKGRLVRFYENKVVDIIGKKKTITRVFPDGFEIWFYNNKDVEQRFPNGRIYYYYHRNKSSEFRFLNDNYLVYKFPNGQYEKHYFDNSVNIKFPDGSYRIIKPNGKELIQFPNGAIQIQDKNGIIYQRK